MKKVFLTILVIALPVAAPAETTVINNVQTTASGRESKSTVKVYTEVNGEVIEDFQKEVQGGEEIRYESEKVFEGGKSGTKVNVRTEVASGSKNFLPASSTAPKMFFESFRKRVERVWKYVLGLFKNE